MADDPAGPPSVRRAARRARRVLRVLDACCAQPGPQTASPHQARIAGVLLAATVSTPPALQALRRARSVLTSKEKS